MGSVELHPVSDPSADECPPQLLEFLDDQRITARMRVCSPVEQSVGVKPLQAATPEFAGSFPSVRPVRRGRCGLDTFSGCLESGVEVLVRSACKSWKCEFCAEMKAELYRRGIVRLAKEYDLATFVTLTLDRLKIRGDMFDYIDLVWHRMLTRLRSRRGFHLNRKSPFATVFGKFPFIRVLELHKDGVPHFHILLPRWVMDDDKWFSLELRKAWTACGGGEQTDVQVVEIRDIGGYVTKSMASYLTKESLVEGIRDRKRRVTTSVGLRISERSYVNTWVRYTMSITEMYRQRLDAGAVARRGSEVHDVWGDLCRVELEMPRSVRTPAEVYFKSGVDGDVVVWERNRKPKCFGAVCAPLPDVDPVFGARADVGGSG